MEDAARPRLHGSSSICSSSALGGGRASPVSWSDEAATSGEADIRRISGLWETCLDRHGGDFLFGPFTIADAMFAPVVSRFRTYQVDLGRACRDYAEAVWNTPEMRDWKAAAETEPHAIPDLDGP